MSQTTMLSQPRRFSAQTSALPMKPAPPVTNTLCSGQLFMKKLFCRRPRQTIRAPAGGNQLFDFHFFQVNDRDLSADVAGDVGKTAIRADQNLLRRFWHVEGLRDLHFLQINESDLIEDR